MNFFNLSLRKHLTLATLPIVLAGALAMFVDEQFSVEFIDTDTSVYIFVIVYCVCFGLFVLAPFITTNKHVAARVALLILGISAIFFAWGMSEGLDKWLPGDDVDLLLAGFVLANTLLAALLKLVAPLRVLWSYWVLTFLAGVIGSFIIYRSFIEVFCLFGPCPPKWMNYLPIVSIVAWQLLFCTAIFFGRNRAMD